MSIGKKRSPRFRVGDPVKFLYGIEKSQWGQTYLLFITEAELSPSGVGLIIYYRGRVELGVS